MLSCGARSQGKDAPNSGVANSRLYMMAAMIPATTPSMGESQCQNPEYYGSVTVRRNGLKIEEYNVPLSQNQVRYMSILTTSAGSEIQVYTVDPKTKSLEHGKHSVFVRTNSEAPCQQKHFVGVTPTYANFYTKADPQGPNVNLMHVGAAHSAAIAQIQEQPQIGSSSLLVASQDSNSLIVRGAGNGFFTQVQQHVPIQRVEVGQNPI
eukprot:Protomagalhaensia_sp_Gyna_25__1887@NODE_1_length_10645_cov_612_087781_g0_i0_p6_GENE_NODE_1_length_10645_cov_612_087781_g0_i0NODE_1_length_10645_cov_612_087781_g0_i0_p6_ORF_typecomplete_len208_score20_11_NODE_1_length_10645_cov_612_087781_g0_i029053528